MLSNAICEYSESIAALRDFVQIVRPLLETHREGVLKCTAEELVPFFLALHALDPDNCPLDASMRDALTKNCDVTIAVSKRDVDGVTTSVNLDFKNGDAIHKFVGSLRKAKLSLTHTGLLYTTCLISLVSMTEHFLARILHSQFEAFPESAGIRDKTLTLRDLQDFDSVDEARKYLIDAKVEEILRGSLSDWVAFLREKLKLSLDYISPIQGNLVETYQRRNLFIHNGGIVNRKYRKKTLECVGECPAIGQTIVVTPAYLKSAISYFERAFILIAAELWKKRDQENESRGNILLQVTFEHLLQERWDIGEQLSLFCIHDNNLPERLRLIAQVNYWQSIKWQGRFNEVEEDVRKGDFLQKVRFFA